MVSTISTLATESHTIHTDVRQQKDSMPQRGILDSVLNQPTNQTPAELMRNAYKSPISSNSMQNMSTTMSPFQLKSILMEHCYARPYNWRPESHFLRPAKTLFIEDNVPKSDAQDIEAELDICGFEEEIVEHYDVEEARITMDECEKHVANVRDTEVFEDWEENVLKVHWSSIQHNLFNSIVTILDNDRLSRLAYAGHPSEPALRRTVIAKSVKRFRRILAQYVWDVNLIQWVHTVLMENLNAWLLGAYLDILQTLTYKLPTFVEKLMGNPNNHNRYTCLNTENLQKLLKRPWNPLTKTSSSERLKQIPGNPVFVMVPNPASFATNVQPKRITRWVSLLSLLGRVETITNNHPTGKRMTLSQCTDQVMLATRAKLKEIHKEHGEKTTFLVGVNATSSIALEIAQVESVGGLICFGFSVYTLAGKRGNPDDNLMELLAPVLFVIGQLANTTWREEVEDIRERMNVETGLLVVGGADDYLRVNKRVKRANGVTQGMIDRNIVEEIFDFVNGLLLSPFPPQIRQTQIAASNNIDASGKRPKNERKRTNSNGSSLDSEPPSPTPTKIARTLNVVRSIATKTVRKIDGKFYAKFETNSVSSSTSSNSITPPNPPSTPESFELSDFNSIKQPCSDKLNGNILFNGKLQGIYSQSGLVPHVKQPGGLKIIPSNPNKQIKVLDNVTISANKNIPKMPSRHSYGPNMVRMPDGRYKAAPPPPVIRGNNTSHLTKLLTNGKVVPGVVHAGPPTTVTRANLTKFITSKKQLQANRTKVAKRVNPYSHPIQAQLPPPTNLTSQDILNLPIIFADDSQLLSSTVPVSTPVIPSQIRVTSASGIHSKVMYVNKPSIVQKRPLPKKLPTAATSSVKYSLSAPIRMDVDIEGELDVSTIPKPIRMTIEQAGYKTDAMSSDIVVNKIVQAIVEQDKEMTDVS